MSSWLDHLIALPKIPSLVGIFFDGLPGTLPGIMVSFLWFAFWCGGFKVSGLLGKH